MRLLFSILLLFSLYKARAQWNPFGSALAAYVPRAAAYDINSLIVDDSGSVYVTMNNGYGYNDNYIVKGNGTSWTQLGNYFNDYINSMVIDRAGNIYAAGDFTNTNGTYVAKWNGTSWSEVGTGSNTLNANAQIYSIVLDSSGNIYAAGAFTNASGHEYVAKWNGSTWSELGSGINTLNIDINPFNTGYNHILTLAIDSKGYIYAGGTFTDSINNRAYIVKWDGTKWSRLGNLENNITAEAISCFTLNSVDTCYHSTTTIFPDYQINSIIVDSNNIIYAAGFTDNNGYAYVAKWDSANWSVLPQALNFTDVISLALDDSGNVYAAGNSGAVGKWNGNTWNYLCCLSSGTSTIALDKFQNVYAAEGNVLGDYNYYYYYIARYSQIVGTAITSKITASPLTIAPNPNNGQFTINLPQAAQVNIYNSIGKLVVTQNMQAGQQQINLGDQLAGMYLLIITGSQPQKVIKFIVE